MRTSTTEPTWFKSSYSGSYVEVAVSPDAVHIRDSKDTDRPHLSVSGPAWARFVTFAARR